MGAATLVLIAAWWIAVPGETPTPPVREPELRAELVKRMKAEQDVRFELMKFDPPFPAQPQRPELQAVLKRMEQIDRENLAWFKGIVEKHGWPGYALVGRDGAQGAFLIAQHATSDMAFMAKCLELLKAAHQAGEARGEWVALMTDRVRVMRDKKKQLYGSQLMRRDGQWVPQPIEDEANVDARRKELGMPPLAEYLKMVNTRAAPTKPGAPPKK